MEKTAICVMVCVFMAFPESASAQSYVMVSGTSMPISSPSNVMVDYSLSTYDTTLEPGDMGTLTLVLKNTGSQRAENVEVIIPDVPMIKISKKFFIGTISAQSTASISVTYLISQNADVGIYTLPVQIQYDGYDSDLKKVNDIRANYDFPMKIYGNPKLTIEGLGFGEIDIGQAFDMTATVKNQGSQAYKVVAGLGGAEQAPQSDQAAFTQNAAVPSSLTPYVQMIQSNPAVMSGLSSIAAQATKATASEKAITVLDTDKKYVGDIPQGASVPVSFRVYVSDRAVSGAYTLPLALEYENKGRDKMSEKFNIGVYVSGRPEISFTNVKTDPQEIHQDEKDVEVKVTVENIGTKEVSNFKMTLDPSLPFKNSRSYVQTKELGMVKPKDASAVSFYIDTAEKTRPDIYGLNFNVEYTVGTKNQKETKTIQIAVKDSPDFELTAPEVNVTAGEKGRITARVVNKGKKCDSVTLWAMKKSDQPFEFDDKSQYIGDLDTDEGGEASLGFTADSAAKERKHIVPLEIRCTLDNKVEVQAESVRVNVLQKEGSVANTHPALLGAGAIIAALVLYSAFHALRSMTKSRPRTVKTKKEDSNPEDKK